MMIPDSGLLFWATLYTRTFTFHSLTELTESIDDALFQRILHNPYVLHPPSPAPQTSERDRLPQ